MVLHNARAEDLILPVGIGGRYGGVGRHGGRQAPSVAISQSRQLGVVHQVVAAPHLLYPHIRVDADSVLTRFAPFSGNEHHAIGTPRPVDGRCRRIFQHFNRFDIVGVDGRERVSPRPFTHARRSRVVIAVDRKTIDYVERFVARIDGVGSPHPNGDASTRCRRGLRYLQTRHTTL